MQRRDLWYMVVFPGTAMTPNRAERARAAASTTQEASNPNRRINGKRCGRTGRCWKVGRGNWGNPSLLVREMCWRKEETHLWVSPLPSHTRLKAVWKWQVSGAAHSGVFYMTQPLIRYVLTLAWSLFKDSLHSSCLPPTHRQSLSHTFIHSCSPPSGSLESSAMYQTPITTHSLPAIQQHIFTHAHTDTHCLFISLFPTVQPFLFLWGVENL